MWLTKEKAKTEDLLIKDGHVIGIVCDISRYGKPSQTWIKLGSNECVFADSYSDYSFYYYSSKNKFKFLLLPEELHKVKEFISKLRDIEHAEQLALKKFLNIAFEDIKDANQASVCS